MISLFFSVLFPYPVCHFWFYLLRILISIHFSTIFSSHHCFPGLLTSLPEIYLFSSLTSLLQPKYSFCWAHLILSLPQCKGFQWICTAFRKKIKIFNKAYTSLDTLSSTYLDIFLLDHFSFQHFFPMQDLHTCWLYCLNWPSWNFFK